MNQDFALTVEEKKDRMDLRPSLDFVSRHVATYRSNYTTFMSRQSQLQDNLRGITYEHTELLDEHPQLRAHQIDDIVARLPKSFQQLSLLKTVNYECNRKVPIPLFDAEGTWIKVDLVPVDEFPRAKDHPSRILIGRSDGHTIYPSVLPQSVCEDVHCRWFYQIHVFIHEFFHSIEYLRRSPELRSKVILEDRHGVAMTLQTWWSRWEDKFAPAMKPRFATRYAANYADSLNWEALHDTPDVFTRSLAEQVCESFAGYIIGLAPNDEDNANFIDHSLEAWILMDDLAHARVVSL